MKKHILSIAAASLMGLGVGCGDETSIDEFEGYGAGHPGAGKKLGGQIFLEKVYRPDEWTGSQGWINGYARTYNDPNVSIADTLALPPIPPGTCMDISTNEFPRQFGDVTYHDLGPEIVLTPETGPVLRAPATENFVDNLQYMVEEGYQNSPFDHTTIQNDTWYDIEFEGSENLNPSRMYMPPPYEVYSHPVGKEELVFSRAEPMVLEWEPVNQTVGGNEHTGDRTFANVIFVGFPDMEAGTQFKVVCPLNSGEASGTFPIPEEVWASLPEAGIMITGQPTHMMADLNGERFDLIAIECNQSRFAFE